MKIIHEVHKSITNRIMALLHFLQHILIISTTIICTSFLASHYKQQFLCFSVTK